MNLQIEGPEFNLDEFSQTVDSLRSSLFCQKLCDVLTSTGCLEGLREVRKTCPTATFYHKEAFLRTLVNVENLDNTVIPSFAEYVEAVLTTKQTDSGFVQEVVKCAVSYFRSELSEEDQKKLPEKLSKLVCSK